MKASASIEVSVANPCLYCFLNAQDFGFFSATIEQFNCLLFFLSVLYLSAKRGINETNSVIIKIKVTSVISSLYVCVAEILSNT